LRNKVLVTGAGGFIGQHLCNDLADRGCSVVGVDLHFPDGIRESNRDFYRSAATDFRNWDVMKELIDGVEIVFHLASAHLQISLPESEYWDINAHSLQPLLDLARRSGVQRFVHVSSVGVYGNLKTWPADEASPCKPQSIYGETKIAGEAEVLSFARTTGFPVVILRPAWVYGPGCPRTLKIYKALRKGRFVMIGNGNNFRHPLYIADMMDCLRLAMDKEIEQGQVFLVAGEKAITTTELVHAFCKVLELPKPKIRIPYSLGMSIATCSELVFGLARRDPPISKRTLEFFDTNNAFDISKARKGLDFNPKFSFEKGLEDSLGWLVKNGQDGRQ